MAAQPFTEPLIAPGHFAFEVMSGLRAAANRPEHPLQEAELAAALHDAEAFEIRIEAIPWTDVHRAWQLAQLALRYADAIYVAAAERHHTALLTSDSRIERSGAPIKCRSAQSPRPKTRTPLAAANSAKQRLTSRLVR